MKCAQFFEFSGPIEIVNAPDPVPGPGGVVVQVGAAGVCRSDWHAWQGHDPDITVLPHISGHEFAGTVSAVGAGVRAWRVGDRVTAPFVCGCGVCTECASGNAQVCPAQFQPGFTGPGAFAEFVALPHADHNLVALPESIGFDTAASLGCRFATAFRALAHSDQAAVQPGEKVAVFGCGGVGLSAVMIAVGLGAEVMAVDIRPEALHRARELGAAHTIEGDAVDSIRELTNGRGVDVTVEALGWTDTCVAAIESLAPRGRHVQVGLMLGSHALPPMPMGRIIAKELRVIGSHGMAAIRYPEMLDMIASGTLAPGRLVSASIRLAELPAAMTAMSSFSGEPGITLIERFR